MTQLSPSRRHKNSAQAHAIANMAPNKNVENATLRFFDFLRELRALVYSNLHREIDATLMADEQSKR